MVENAHLGIHWVGRTEVEPVPGVSFDGTEARPQRQESLSFELLLGCKQACIIWTKLRVQTWASPLQRIWEPEALGYWVDS